MPHLVFLVMLVFGLGFSGGIIGCTESSDDSGDNWGGSFSGSGGSSAGSSGGTSCCKICETGKPCGDTCIASSNTCNSPPGCACYGNGDESGAYGDSGTESESGG